MIPESTLVAGGADADEILVSVVTIALNAARDLPLTIESVIGQDFGNFEYIVVDGQSWDSSHEVFRRYEKYLTVVETEDSGVYWAMNFATTQCRGKYIIFMNAGDTFYSPKSLSNIFRQCRDKDPDIIYGDHVYIDNKLELHKQSVDFRMIYPAILNDAFACEWLNRFPCHQATLTKRELLVRMGGYDTRLEICADHDFFLRAFEAGATTKYVNETIAHYYGGGMSALRTDRTLLEWIKLYRSKSLFPDKIDKFFRGKRLVRFDTQSEMTGGKISGFYPLEFPSSKEKPKKAFSWCSGDSFTVLSPLKHGSIGISFIGRNNEEGQKLTLTSLGQTLCEVDVPLGEFEISAPFPHPIPRRSLIEVVPARAALLRGGRSVSLLLECFRFHRLDDLGDHTLSAGRSYSLDEAGRRGVAPLLWLGWSHAEPTHTWSVGKQSTLLMSLEESVTKMSIVMGGNPFVADEDRRIKVSINGKPVAIDLPLSIGAAEYVLDLSLSEWRSGSNLITVIPFKSCAGPEDPREMGIRLYSIRVD
jgi:glycosyltransferase involved in cell wall biosynthesis